MQLLEDLLILDKMLTVRKAISIAGKTITDPDADIGVSGVPTIATSRDYRLEIVLGGEVGTATFRWSDTNGNIWNESDLLTGPSVALLDSGISVDFSAINGGIFTAGDYITWVALSLADSLALAALIVDPLTGTVKLLNLFNQASNNLVLQSTQELSILASQTLSLYSEEDIGISAPSISLQPLGGNLTLGTFSGLLKATEGVVSAASPGSDYVAEESDPVAMGYIDQSVKAADSPSFAGLTLGVDAATNTPGLLKLWSAGANNNYLTLAAGVMSEVSAYTLPTAKPASAGFLKSDASGVMSWDTGVYSPSSHNHDSVYRSLTGAVNINTVNAQALRVGSETSDVLIVTTELGNDGVGIGMAPTGSGLFIAAGNIYPKWNETDGYRALSLDGSESEISPIMAFILADDPSTGLEFNGAGSGLGAGYGFFFKLSDTRVGGFDSAGYCTVGVGYKSVDGSAGVAAEITTSSLVGKTITVKDGLITGFA